MRRAPDCALDDEIVAVKEACGDAHLKVILETGELGTYDSVRRASILAMAAGNRSASSALSSSLRKDTRVGSVRCV